MTKNEYCCDCWCGQELVSVRVYVEGAFGLVFNLPSIGLRFGSTLPLSSRIFSRGDTGELTVIFSIALARSLMSLSSNSAGGVLEDFVKCGGGSSTFIGFWSAKAPIGVYPSGKYLIMNIEYQYYSLKSKV